MAEQRKLLLEQYEAQIPAHASYIITVILGIVGFYIGAIQLSSIWFATLLNYQVLIVIFIVLTLAGGFLFFRFYGRLIYYTKLVSILNGFLQVTGNKTVIEFRPLFEVLEKKTREDFGMAQIVYWGFAFKLENEEKSLFRKFYLQHLAVRSVLSKETKVAIEDVIRPNRIARKA